MSPELQSLYEVLQQVKGYVYPNEVELQWGLLVVAYPYLTGLVAGAFILASLERVFNVREVQPTYRLSLLTALAFLIVAPLPLLAHLGHPERCLEMFLTPNLNSAMAMFGFVYAWYLAVVLLLEIWFDYRKDLVLWSRQEKGFARLLHRIMTLGVMDISPGALRFDFRAGKFITMIGIPSAFLLHGYVGFIFGSVKANPWWSSVLIPIVFLFSAMVSGIALVLVLFMLSSLVRGKEIDMPCADKLSSFLLYALIVDFSLELLDFIHRLYQAGAAGHAAAADRAVSGQPGLPQPRPGAGPRRAPPVDLLRRRGVHPDRHFQHSLERGDRRPVVFQESARPDGLQDGADGAGGLLHVRYAAIAAFRGSLCSGARIAALARRRSPHRAPPALKRRQPGMVHLFRDALENRTVPPGATGAVIARSPCFTGMAISQKPAWGECGPVFRQPPRLDGYTEGR
jgi:formate-dependent nitrite reductase membrane component NrfD